MSERKFTETPFVYLTGAGEEIFINLLQVVRANVVGTDQISLLMSDGRTINFEGGAVPQLIERLADFTMLPDGSRLVDADLATRRIASSVSKI